MHDFEELDGVTYQDITKLFWNFYPYKVNLSDLLVKPQHRGGYNSDSSIYAKNKKEWNTYLTKRTNLYYEMRTFCNEELGIEWTSKNNDQTFSFFFRSPLDAQRFILQFRTYTKTVFRPENFASIDALGQDSKLLLRETLFYPNEEFGGYRHYVEFHYQHRQEDEEELDECIIRLFNEEIDDQRYRYVYNNRRRLYLNNRSDIMYIKLGVDNDKIRGYYSVLLKSEI